jgi:putative hydrolase of the HAD superfamily
MLAAADRPLLVAERPALPADLRHIDTWLFDLDHTLYPPECGLMGLVDVKMDEYVSRLTGVPNEEAKVLRHQYYIDHGTTLAGLMHHHEIDPAAYITEVQDVAMDCVAEDPRLRAALQRLPGRRLVFTNAGEAYAHKVLAKLGIADLFEDVFAIEMSDYVPKPQDHAFSRMVARHAVTPKTTAFFEDSARNLAPAAALGMTTVLIGPDALENTAAFVHHRTETLPPFLEAARVTE